ncbi:UNVERIFIED_CONTAM: hypothetical protein Slati_3456200 [Sesamum latifolium]|uniref:Uncharacterized protein n=1 Tax=Sesamum latifolium TaxID=2727402 RepID=A0AAW2UHI8_9LAMI
MYIVCATTATSKPGNGGLYRPPRGDDGRHDRYDSGDAASSSVAGPSQPTASSTAPTQPTIDPQLPNDDEMGGLD